MRISVLRLYAFLPQFHLPLFAHLSFLRGDLQPGTPLLSCSRLSCLCFCCSSQQRCLLPAEHRLPSRPPGGAFSLRAFPNCPSLFPGDFFLQQADLLGAESWSALILGGAPLQEACVGVHSLMRGVGIEGSDCILGLPVLACVDNCPLRVSFGSPDPVLPSASVLLLGWFPHSSQPQELCSVDSLPGHLIPPLVFIPSVNCRLLCSI